MKRLGIWFLTALASVTLLLGCAQGMAGGGSPIHVDAVRAKSYHSIQDLNADSIAVVRITATNTRSVEQIVAVPYTVTVVKVDQALRGAVGGPTIKLRQMGSPSSAVVIEDGVPLVQPGQSYVAFLLRFTYGPGRATDQYTPVGAGAGLFLDQAGMLQRLDPASPDLPATLPLADLQQQLAS